MKTAVVRTVLAVTIATSGRAVVSFLSAQEAPGALVA